MRINDSIKQLLPPFVYFLLRRIYALFGPGFRGDFDSFDVAMSRTSGYGASAVAERNLEALNKYVKDLQGAALGERSQQLLAAIGLVSLDMRRPPKTVLDFAGGNGGYYFDIRRIVPGEIDRWVVYETPATVQSLRGVEDGVIKFTDTIKFDQDGVKFDFVFASGALQYFREPYKELVSCLRLGRYVCLNRLPVVAGAKDRITIQTPPRSLYENAKFPAWFLSEKRLQDVIDKEGGVVMAKWKVPQDAPLLDGKVVVYQGYLIKCRG